MPRGLAQNTTFSTPGVRGTLIFRLAPLIKEEKKAKRRVER